MLDPDPLITTSIVLPFSHLDPDQYETIGSAALVNTESNYVIVFILAGCSFNYVHIVSKSGISI